MLPRKPVNCELREKILLKMKKIPDRSRKSPI
jgi:hypothetical protein